MVGDALFVRPSGTAEGSREFKGYVHRIHLETVISSLGCCRKLLLGGYEPSADFRC